MKQRAPNFFQTTVVLLLFFASGALGLIYEVVWSRMMMHVFGSTAIAVGTVDRDSPAWQTGLRKGDILLEVNRERVRNLEELRLVLSRSRGISTLRIRRGDRLILLSRR